MEKCQPERCNEPLTWSEVRRDVPHRVPGEQAGLVDVAPTNQVASPEHVSVADVLSNRAEAPTPLRGGRMAKEDTVPGATPAAGRACGGGHISRLLFLPQTAAQGVWGAGLGCN